MFEIGHAAALKTKPSKEGFTHDWELFVRGSNDSDIGHFVEKVIFNLHDSFPKPKRAIKEPPYTIKEAGYAGFVLTIDIYLRNRDEPKKVTFEYDLDLQPIKTQLNEFIVQSPSEEFRRKCLKGGGVLVNSTNEFKNRDLYNKNQSMLSSNEIKKSSKRPEETKPNKVFTDLFGPPLKKPDARSIQNSSPNLTKLQPTMSNKTAEKSSTASVVGGKDKNEKTKHKHSPNKDAKDKKSVDIVKIEQENTKKDKPKDRDRNEKKVSKRPLSPSPSSSSSARNSTNPNALPQSKNDAMKPQSKQSLTPTSDPSKKSSKKDKKSHEKDRDRNEKKDARPKESFPPTKDKSQFDLPPSKGRSVNVKERDSFGKDERDKIKSKPTPPEPKTTLDVAKKQHGKDTERKHKHKKKEKAKDKDVGKDNNKKEKTQKNVALSPAMSKEPTGLKQELLFKAHPNDKMSSDSDVDSPPSIKQDSDNSMPEIVPQKMLPVPEKIIKKQRERSKVADKEDKGRKKKSSKRDDRESSASPPPSKMARIDSSKSPSTHDRPSSSDSNVHLSHSNNNNNNDGNNKISNDYMNELKDLKLKITTLKNNEELQQVVKLIAATGCYEITKSSFDFDLVQLDRDTVQRLQQFFALS